jgi:aerobic-type carbon monoxide dehydrogenase small subunit (CoxS/CutS family)
MDPQNKTKKSANVFQCNAGQILVKTLNVNTCITLETEMRSKALPIYAI